MFIPFANTNQFDPDAGAFINVTGIGGIEAVAINNLVNQLKSAGLWTYMKAIYPMVGNSADTCRFNLVNPQNTDAAFRLSFFGTWTFSNSGAKPDGVAGTYADTFFVPSTGFTTTNGHFSYYSFTNNAAAVMVEMGANGAASAGECNLALRFSDSNQYAFFAGAGGNSGATVGTSAGYLINNRAALTEGWRNGVRAINTGNGAALTSQKMVLAGQNNNGTIFRNSSRGCAFASIGNSLPTGGAVNLTNIVNTFCRTLQRNVF
jgi:hypothetical protein